MDSASGPAETDDDPPVTFADLGNLKQAAAKSVFWSASQKWGSEALETAIYVVLARMIVPEQFGLVAMARVFVSLAQLLLDQGLESAIVQRAELRRSHLDTAFWTNVGFGAALALIGIVAAAPIAGALISHEDTANIDSRELATILRVLTISFVLGSTCGVPTALLRRQLQYRALAIRNWVAGLTAGTVGIALAFAGAGAWSLVWMQVSSAVVAVPVLWLNSSYRPGLRVTRAAFRDLFAYGSNVFGYRLMSYFGAQTDRVLVGRALGAAQLGYYAMGQRASVSLSRLFGQTIAHVALPTFSRVQHDRPRLLSSYLSMIRLLTVLGAPAYFGVAATAPDLVRVAFGDVWLPATPVVQVLSCIEFVQAIVLVNSVVIMAIGRPGRLLALNAIATVAKIAALLMFGRLGIMYVAFTCVADALVLLPVQVVMLRTGFDLTFGGLLAAVVRPLVASCAMAATVMLVAAALPIQSGALRLGVLVPVGALVYLACMLVIDRGGLGSCVSAVKSLLERRRGPEPA